MQTDGIDTVLPADTVEFCPHPDATNIFLCGTYKLLTSENEAADSAEHGSHPITPVISPQKRCGQCLVYTIDPPLDRIRVNNVNGYNHISPSII